MKKIWDEIFRIKSVKDISSLSVANVGGGAIAAIFWFYVASILTPEEYGEISYLISIGGITSVICQFGIGYFTTVYTAKKQNVLPAVALISISSSIVASIVLYFLFKEPALGIFAVGYLLYTLGIADLFGRKYYKKYAVILISQKILLLALGFAFYNIFGNIGFIYGYGLSMFVFSYHIYTSLKKTKLDFLIFKQKIGFALNTYFENIVKSVSNEADKFVIAPILGFAMLGNFHLGMQILSVLSIFPGIISQYIIPEEASGESKTKLKKYFIILSISLAIIGIFIAPIMIAKFFPKYLDAIDIIPIISVAIIFGSINSIMYSKFLANEKSRFTIISSLIFSAIEIPLIIVLGKTYEITGIAIAFLIALVSQTIFLIICDRFLKVSTNKE